MHAAETNLLETQTNPQYGAMMQPATAKITPVQSEFFSEERSRAKPILKWAGGKTRLLPLLRACLSSQTFNRYFEPFLGGGAFFFDLAPSSAYVSDSNRDLIQCYEAVRDFPNEVIAALLDRKVTEHEFYKIRALDPESLGPVERASRFIYLNKTCYNGLYRVNKNGQFNTPYGRNSKVSLVDAKNVRAASRILKNASLIAQDYQVALSDARRGDFVYLDPPYLPVGKFSDFKRYTKEFFYEEDHRRLAELFQSLANRGCLVLLSNSYHDKIAELYSGFNQLTVKMPRFINCKGEGRGAVKELLISNFPFIYKK